MNILHLNPDELRQLATLVDKLQGKPRPVPARLARVVAKRKQAPRPQAAKPAKTEPSAAAVEKQRERWRQARARVTARKKAEAAEAAKEEPQRSAR